MFDGSYRSKRGVRLSGKNKQEEKTEFIRRAREERRGRANERNRILASVHIQAKWRSVLVRRRVKNIVRDRWRKKIHDICVIRDMVENSLTLPLPVISTLLREFLFFIGPISKLQAKEFDTARKDLADLCQLIVDSFMQEDMKNNFVALSSSGGQAWMFQMKKLMQICILDLKHMKTFSYNEQTSNFMLDLLGIITGVKPSPLTMCEISRQLCISLTIPTPITIFEALQRCLVIDSDSLFDANEFIFRCTKNCLEILKNCSDELKDKAYQAFTWQIFCIDNVLAKESRLWQILDKKDLASICRRAVHAMAFSHATPGHRDVRHSIVRNVLSIAYEDKACIVYAAYLVRFICRYLDADDIARSFMTMKQENNEADDSTPDINSSESLPCIAERLIREESQSISSRINSNSRPTLTILCEPGFSVGLFEGVLKRDDEDGAFYGLCNLFRRIITFSGGSVLYNTNGAATGVAAQILSSIGFGSRDDPIVRRLWETICKFVDIDRYAADALYALENSQMEDVIYVMFATYSHLLMALDDETFYYKEYPLAVKKSRDIATFLGKLLYRLYWGNDSVLSKPYNLRDLCFLITATRLFNQLYDKDCRRSYCAPKSWVWPYTPLRDVVAPTELLYGSHNISFVLRMVPQVLPFDQRVALFQQLLEADRMLVSGRDMFVGMTRSTIRREMIYDDSFDLFSGLRERSGPEGLKSRMQITFVNAQGLHEAGVDGGGVFKEFLDALTKHAFDPQYGLFLATSDELLYPHPDPSVKPDHDVLQHYEFLGRVLGKAVYEGILVEPLFAPFFLNKLLGKYNYVDDLRSLDPETYRNLISLKDYPGRVEDLGLTFSVTRQSRGQNISLELCPNGMETPVTADNRIRYIHLFANHRLNVELHDQCRAFLNGFRDLIPAAWIRMFNPDELQMLIGGSDKGIGVNDWFDHTLYSGGYHPTQNMIQWFWEIVRAYSGIEKAKLLKFITSCSRQPLLGFSRLKPQICIQQVRIENDERLPTSSTCMNLLKLPTYSSKAILYEKLTYSINSNAGFELS